MRRHATSRAALRVLMVNDRPLEGGGGAERYVARITDAHRAAGHHVEVLAGEVHHRGAGRLLDAWDPLAARLVARRAREVRADVVHHHNVLRELSVAVLRATPDLPTVLTVHDHALAGGAIVDGPAPLVLARRAVHRMDRTVARRAVDAVTTVSEVLAGALRDVGFDDVTPIPLPGDPPVRDPQPVQDCTDVVYVGRLSADKGVRELVEAVGHLRADHPVELHLAGDGPLHDQLTRTGHPWLHLHGHLDAAGVSGLLGRARVVAVPAHGPEGASMAVVEAALHGRPVVVGRAAAVREVAAALGAGPATDGTPAGLAEALAPFLADAGHAADVGAAAGVAARERHDPARVAEALRDVYRRAGA